MYRKFVLLFFRMWLRCRTPKTLKEGRGRHRDAGRVLLFVDRDLFAGGPAAVDLEGGAGDEGGLVTGEVEDGGGDLFGAAHAADGLGGGHCRIAILPTSLPALRKALHYNFDIFLS